MVLCLPIMMPFRSHLTHNLVQVSAFLFGALCLAIPSGYSYGPIILSIMSLFVFWRADYWSAMSREVKILFWIFIFYFTVQAVSIFLDGGALKELDRPSRALMAAMILPLLSKHQVRLVSIMSGFACGAVISGIIAIYDKFYIGMDRAFGNGMPIQSGNISMTLGLFCLCAYFWYRENNERKFSNLMLVACLMGMIGSFLSGTRGGWVLLPVIIATIVMHYQTSERRYFSWAFICFFIGVVSIVSIPQTGVFDRMQTAKTDIVQFIDGENPDTSLGIRFQLWSSAWDAFQKKPIWGWGNNGIREIHQQQLEQGKISDFIYNFNYHAHNQFLDEMAKRGIIGLLALCLVYFYPISIYRKHKKSSSMKYILMAVASLTLIDYSLTQAFISHNSGIVFFFVCFSLLTTSLNEPYKEV
ncbi:O-antigen ligase family protein [Aeromonas enteropelogenes]|uniref:O-antigen ligase family protein n=1 Tax=Aeromonas enteropelogenes TaxID=29489 RepID=UPI003B9FDE93